MIQFLMTFLWNIRFGMSKAFKNGNKQCFCSVSRMLCDYQQHGFRVKHALMDGQFEPIHGDLAVMGMMLNTASNNEHMPEIERYIWTVKECTCAIYNTLPFKHMPG
jgi:hypothetical protein